MNVATFGELAVQYPGPHRLSSPALNPSENTWGRFPLDATATTYGANHLVKVCAKMKEIEIYNLGDTRTCKAALATVIKCLVDTILGGRTIKLKRLLLKPGCLLSPAVRLATALNKIEILEVQLFHEDLNLLFKAMMQGETSVTSLSSLWGHLYLSELDPESFFWRV